MEVLNGKVKSLNKLKKLKSVEGDDLIDDDGGDGIVGDDDWW